MLFIWELVINGVLLFVALVLLGLMLVNVARGVVGSPDCELSISWKVGLFFKRNLASERDFPY